MTIVCSLIRVDLFVSMTLYSGCTVSGGHSQLRSSVLGGETKRTEPELDSRCMHGLGEVGWRSAFQYPLSYPPSADRQVKIKVLRVLTFICTFVYLLRLNYLLNDSPLATSLILFHLFYGIKCVLLVNMAKYMPLLKSFNIASTVYTINNNIKIYSR